MKFLPTFAAVGQVESAKPSPPGGVPPEPSTPHHWRSVSASGNTMSLYRHIAREWRHSLKATAELQLFVSDWLSQHSILISSSGRLMRAILDIAFSLSYLVYAFTYAKRFACLIDRPCLSICAGWEADAIPESLLTVDAILMWSVVFQHVFKVHPTPTCHQGQAHPTPPKHTVPTPASIQG